MSRVCTERRENVGHECTFSGTRKLNVLDIYVGNFSWSRGSDWGPLCYVYIAMVLYEVLHKDRQMRF